MPPSQLPTDACGESPPLFECETDLECTQYVEQFIDERIAGERPGGRQLEIAQCVQGCGAQGACACMFRLPGRSFLDALELVVLGGSDSCDAISRARYCIARPNDFTGCAPDESSICDAACVELLDELERDALGRDVTVRAARCDDGRCLSVWEVDGHCLAGTPIPEHVSEIDCARSDDALLDELATSLEPVVDASAATPDAGMGTLVPHDAGVGSRAGSPRQVSDGPLEPDWHTQTDDTGAVWASALACGAEIGPVCVDGACPDRAVDGGTP